jgi:hypothetical protein
MRVLVTSDTQKSLDAMWHPASPSGNRNGLDEAQAPTAEMAETPPSIKKSDPTTYAESSDAR